MGKKRVIFEFRYEYNKEGSDDIILDKKCVYKSKKVNGSLIDYIDRIIISKRMIMITGTRSGRDSLKNCLKKTNNHIYCELVKSVVFVYVTQGCVFQRGDCLLKIDGDIYREDSYGEIKDLCRKKLDSFMILSPNIVNKVFDNSPWSKALLVSLIEYICAYNMNVDDYEVQLFEMWKAFNTIYKYYYSTANNDKCQGTEKRSLKAIGDFIKNNFSGNELSVVDVAKNANKVLDFRIKKMLLNKKKSGNTESKRMKYVKECVTNCRDKRLLNIYMDIINADATKFCFSPPNKQEIDDHFASISSNSDKDLLCFIILEYGYYVRCKHFHGERGTPMFLVNNNQEAEEMKLIVDILYKLLVDLYKTIN